MVLPWIATGEVPVTKSRREGDITTSNIQVAYNNYGYRARISMLQNSGLNLTMVSSFSVLSPLYTVSSPPKTESCTWNHYVRKLLIPCHAYLGSSNECQKSNNNHAQKRSTLFFPACIYINGHELSRGGFTFFLRIFSTKLFSRGFIFMPVSLFSN